MYTWPLMINRKVLFEFTVCLETIFRCVRSSLSFFKLLLCFVSLFSLSLFFFLRLSLSLVWAHSASHTYMYSNIGVTHLRVSLFLHAHSLLPLKIEWCPLPYFAWWSLSEINHWNLWYARGKSCNSSIINSYSTYNISTTYILPVEYRSPRHVWNLDDKAIEAKHVLLCNLEVQCSVRAIKSMLLRWMNNSFEG